MTQRRYPPPNHILRHLRLSHYEDARGELVATMEVLDDLTDAAGWLRLGAIATLVDSVAGHHSVMAVTPDWVATLHLATVLCNKAVGEMVEATCVPLRVGRNQLVSDITTTDAAGGLVARSVCTYARLPRRDDTPVVDSTAEEAVVHYREPAELVPRPPLDDYLGLSPEPDAPRMEVPMGDRIRNSFGSLQGGASVVIAEVMATHVARLAHQGGELWRCTQADVHFLAPARGGPIAVEAAQLSSTERAVTVDVRYYDRANDDRLIQVATATAERAS